MKYFVKFFFIVLVTNSVYNSFAQYIFKAHKASSWYPKEEKELKDLLQKLIEKAKRKFAIKTDSTKIRAIISPHAGYEFSGEIAAAVYNLLDKDNIDQIIVLAPSHFVAFNGIAFPLFEKYSLPIGIIDLNLSSINKLQKSPKDDFGKKSLVTFSNDPFKPEHSLEMQLPFIKYILPKVKIIPIVVGHISDKNIREIVLKIKALITNKTLVVISSDFTHYGKQFDYVPFTKNILLNLKQLDSSVLETIQHQTLQGFEKIIKTTKDTVCGYNPIRILLELIKQNAFGEVNTRLVAYGNSYEKSQDLENIVTYASLIITNEINNKLLDDHEKRSLLKYSRAILEQAFKKNIKPKLLKPILTLLLEKPEGAFVTLYKYNKKGKKELRGCIGQVEAINPLYKVVAEKTLDSAFRDSRFNPVTQDELKNIAIEISVLSKPRSITSYKEIILNKHGIILTNGKKSALFLPKVPQEFGFNLKQTLQELSIKAGLDKDAWKLSSTKFQVFESQDFGETLK